MTPTPMPNASQYAQTIQSWGDLSVVMAVLLILALGIVAFIIFQWRNKNNGLELVLQTTHEQIRVLSTLLEGQQQSFKTQEAQHTQEHEKTIESFGVFSDAHNRVADGLDKVAAATASIQALFRNEIQRSAESWGIVTDKLTDAQELLETIQHQGSEPTQRGVAILEQLKLDAEVFKDWMQSTDEWKKDMRADVDMICVHVENILKNCSEPKTEPAPVILLPDEPKVGAA